MLEKIIQEKVASLFTPIENIIFEHGYSDEYKFNEIIKLIDKTILGKDQLELVLRFMLYLSKELMIWLM